MEVPIQKFAEDVTTRGLISKKIYIREHKTRKFYREESVKRARERIGEAGWNLLVNNCEHFVEWCVDGKFGPEEIDGSPKLPKRSSINTTLKKKFEYIINNECLIEKLCVIARLINISIKTHDGKTFWNNICEAAAGNSSRTN